MSKEIDIWLDSGAEVNEGLRLLNLYAPNKNLALLVSKNSRYSYLLKKVLLPFSSKVSGVTIKKGYTFRENWPFLASPTCPPELKILAADKISAWNNQATSYDKLFICTTPEQCYLTAKKVIENYIENRRITSEFQYYLEHEKILGKHPIFTTTKHIAELRSMSILDIMRRQKNLKENIWRIKNEISKNNKPHLQIERKLRLQQRELELSEINRIVEEYAREK